MGMDHRNTTKVYIPMHPDHTVVRSSSGSERPIMPPLPSARAASPTRGRSLVVGLVLLGFAGAVAGIAYQRVQTGRCLGFYGAEVAHLVNTAPRVELLRLAPGGSPGRLVARDVRDVTLAKGLVHLRRGLVEDANFRWPESPPREPLGADAWDYALEFSDAAGGVVTTLVLDVDPAGGSLAVVGAPGRVALGRVGPGLATWIRATLEKPTTADTPGR